MSSDERKKVDKSAKKRNMRDMRHGIDTLKRLVGSQAKIAAALGITEEQVSRIANGRSPVPGYMDAVAEFLEAVPPKDWPERWR